MERIPLRLPKTSGRLVLATILACLAAPAWAADPTDDTGIRVARLIRDLGSRDFAEREAAHQKLHQLGGQTRAQLEQALADDDLEVRLRAKRLLEKLRLDELWAPGRIQLQVADQPASKILSALAAQTGNHVHVGDPYGNFAEQNLTVDYQASSFWEALDDVCRRSGNRVRPHYDVNTPGIVVSSGSLGKYPRAYTGPLRAQITTARRLFIEEVNFEEHKSELTHSFQFNLQLTWEDRLRVVAYATQPELVEAVTDNHVVVSAMQPGPGAWNASGKGVRQVGATLKLNPITLTAERLDVLKIRWGLVAAGDPAVLEIQEIDLGRRYSQDDVAVQIESLEDQPGSRCSLVLNVMRDLAMPDPQEAVFHELDVELFDQLGRAYRVQNQMQALSERGVQLKLTFSGESVDSRPKSIKLHYPRVRARRDLELTFRNVPLPIGKPE